MLLLLLLLLHSESRSGSSDAKLLWAWLRKCAHTTTESTTAKVRVRHLCILIELRSWLGEAHAPTAGAEA